MNKTNIDSILILSSILDEYYTFKSNLEHIKKDNFKKFIIILSEYSNEYRRMKLLYPNKIILFYKNNKKIIDIINKKMSVDEFVSDMYNPNIDLDFYYNYLIKNYNKKDLIIKNLNKIQELGFMDIIFTNNEYNINNELNNIKYRLVNSNYKIIFYKDSNYIFENDFILNNLLFDTDLLPTKEMLNKIIDREKKLLKIIK